MRLLPSVLLLAVLSSLSVAATAAQPAAAPASAVQPAPPSEALCTAHFDRLSRQLAQRVAQTPEAARAQLQAELLNVLKAGTAFVGHAYLDSVPEKEAKARLDQAKEELERLGPGERDRIAPVCVSMSAELRKKAPAWQRLIADRLAAKRAQRLVKSAQEALQAPVPANSAKP